MIAIADYHYTSNAYSITSAENGMALADGLNGPIYELSDSVLIKGLKVANGPQLNTSLKLSFFHPKMWFADITVSYFDWNYLDYAPSRRMQGLFTGTRADGTTVNGSYKDAGAIQTYTDGEGNTTTLTDKYGIPDLPNRQSLSINLSVSNITNNTHMKTGGYQQSRLPRANVQMSTPEKSVITSNVWKFPSKYYYAWGANFFLSLTYKF